MKVVILAGGLGRRMGGIDKGLQELRGRPLTAWVVERLAPQVDELLINANQNPESYAAFGHRVVPDQIPDFAGPLWWRDMDLILSEAENAIAKD